MKAFKPRRLCLCLFDSVSFPVCKVQEAVVELEEAVEGGERLSCDFEGIGWNILSGWEDVVKQCEGIV